MSPSLAWRREFRDTLQLALSALHEIGIYTRCTSGMGRRMSADEPQRTIFAHVCLKCQMKKARRSVICSILRIFIRRRNVRENFLGHQTDCSERKSILLARLSLRSADESFVFARNKLCVGIACRSLATVRSARFSSHYQRGLSPPSSLSVSLCFLCHGDINAEIITRNEKKLRKRLSSVLLSRTLIVC